MQPPIPERSRRLPPRPLRETAQLAARGGAITYGDAGFLVGLPPRSPVLHSMLGYITEMEHKAGRPLLTAIIVRQDTDFPGAGFFRKAQRLGVYDGHTEKPLFWWRECERVYRHWVRVAVSPVHARFGVAPCRGVPTAERQSVECEASSGTERN